MPIEITMPRLSDTMESGTVIKWNVAEGDRVSSGDVVADVETDKATMELTVYDDGTLARIVVAEGQVVDVGTVIALLAEPDEDLGDVRAAPAPVASAPAGGDAAAGSPADPPAGSPADPPAGSPADPPADPPAMVAAEAPAPAADVGDGRLKASPVARRMADEHGIDIRTLQGTGPGGRIVKRDVAAAFDTGRETAAAVPPSAAPAVPGLAPAVPATVVPVLSAPLAPPAPAPLPGGLLEPRRVPLSSMRQTIARRLVESKTTIPHYQVTMTFDMDPLLDLRRTLNDQLAPLGVKLSVNDFLVRACALAMHRHPEFNASFDGDAIVIHGAVNVGMAISVGPERGGGLVVGVIRFADQKSLRAISAESRDLAEKARTRGLTLEEMSDSTFTLSNLGMFGVDHFTAIINPPNSAILAVGAAIEKPVVRAGQLTVGHEMSATLSNDHRVIDGAVAAQFLQTLRQYIESPGALLV